MLSILMDVFFLLVGLIGLIGRIYILGPVAYSSHLCPIKLQQLLGSFWARSID